MGRQSVEAQDTAPLDRAANQLAARVLAIVDSPPAWLGKRVRIHRLDTDGDAEWGEVMDRLAATNGLQMDFEEAGSVILQWEGGGEIDAVFERKKGSPAVSNEPAPF